MRIDKLPSRANRTSLDSSLTIVNIVLLLIFFFLTTGSLQNSDSIAIALPETSELALDQLPKPLLAIAADGSLTLNDEPIAPGTLAERTLDEAVLHILADRGSSAAQILETLADENLSAIQIRLVTVHQIKGQGE